MTTTITTQTVRSYNTRGNITGTETITGDAIDRNYGDIKPVAPHGLNLSAMKALATSSDPVDRVLVAQQRNITKALTQTLAQDTDLDVVNILGLNSAGAWFFESLDSMSLPVRREVNRIDGKVGKNAKKLAKRVAAVHPLVGACLTAISDITDFDILMDLSKNHPHALVRNYAKANIAWRIDEVPGTYDITVRMNGQTQHATRTNWALNGVLYSVVGPVSAPRPTGR